MKNYFRAYSVIVLILLMSPFIFSCQKKDSSAQQTFKLSENQPPSNPVTKAMEMFAELVEEGTDGEIKIDVYHSAQLGQETENIEQVQMGVIEFARVNSVTLAQTISEIGVFTLPYIFDDNDHKYRVLDGEIGNEVLDSFEKYGLVSFGYLEAGTRNFYTTKPVKTIEDLKGLKIRVQPSEVAIKMVRLLGAVPTPMNYGEVYSALQTGVIDGAENDFVSYDTSSHYEVAKTYVLDGHLSPPAVIIMSKEKYDALTPKQQEAIKVAAKKATEYERKAMNDMQKVSEKKVVAAGSIIVEVDVNAFQEATKSIYDDYPQYEDVIRRIREL